MFANSIFTLALIALPIYFFFRWVQYDSENQDKPK
jgi:hypothetical protein